MMPFPVFMKLNDFGSAKDSNNTSIDHFPENKMDMGTFITNYVLSKKVYVFIEIHKSPNPHEWRSLIMTTSNQHHP